MVPKISDVKRETAADVPAPAVRRVTTRYVPEEDRIQFLLELSPDEVKVLWLTRRLLNRLLPQILERLEGAWNDTPDTAPAPVLQKFKQAAAVSGIKPQKAVSPAVNTAQKQSDVLITSVDVRRQKKTFIFHMKAGDHPVTPFPFTEEVLRQWLGVLHAQYKAGGWTENFWPSWMDSTSREDVAALRLN